MTYRIEQVVLILDPSLKPGELNISAAIHRATPSWQ